jgi:hypothetical protein
MLADGLGGKELMAKVDRMALSHTSGVSVSRTPQDA